MSDLFLELGHHRNVELPPSQTRSFELELDRDELDHLRVRAASEGLAPDEDDQLLRYLVYLGTAYLEAERLIDQATSSSEAYDELHRRFGAVGGADAVLRFRWGEAARNYAAESRAAAAHDRFAGTYQVIVEKMESEIGIRERRIANLEEALGR